MPDHREYFQRGMCVVDRKTFKRGTVTEVTQISVIVRPDDQDTVIQFTPDAAMRDLFRAMEEEE